MKKFIAMLTLLIMFSATAQAGMTEQEFAKTMGPFITEGTDGFFEYSEKYQSFVIASLSPAASYRKLTEYEAQTAIGIVEQSPGYISAFPNTGVIHIMGKSENEFYWVIGKQAGIVFVYDNVAGEIIYFNSDDMPLNAKDFY